MTYENKAASFCIYYPPEHFGIGSRTSEKTRVYASIQGKKCEMVHG